MLDGSNILSLGIYVSNLAKNLASTSYKHECKADSTLTCKGNYSLSSIDIPNSSWLRPPTSNISFILPVYKDYRMFFINILLSTGGKELFSAILAKASKNSIWVIHKV